MILTYYIANLLDAFITLYAVQHGYAREGNAVMRNILCYPWEFVAIKAIIPLGICRWMKSAPKLFCGVVASVQTAIVVWNIIIVVNLGVKA